MLDLHTCGFKEWQVTSRELVGHVGDAPSTMNAHVVMWGFWTRLNKVVVCKCGSNSPAAVAFISSRKCSGIRFTVNKRFSPKIQNDFTSKCL